MAMDAIDFESCRLDEFGAEFDCTKPTVKTVAKTIYEKMHKDGFVYLKNHGIDMSEIEQVTDRVKEFFDLPVDDKQKYHPDTLFKTDPTTAGKFAANQNVGWVPFGSEIYHGTQYNLNESINISPMLDVCKGWPLGPGFKHDMIGLYSKCDSIANRILQILAIGMELQDISIIAGMRMGSFHNNCSALRFLQYPPVTKPNLPGQQSLHLHTDIGFISLLFQDKANLELQTPDGIWVPSTHTDDTMLVIAGDALQRLSSDELLATPHRVAVPGKSWRRSIVFFAHPDDDSFIGSINGSGKYPRKSHKQAIMSKFLAPETGLVK